MVAAVVLSSATAAVTQTRPPTLDETTTFIVDAVRRYTAAAVARDDEQRGWRVDAVFAGCVVEKRTSYETPLLGTWEPRSAAAVWELGEIDEPAIHVARKRDKDFAVTLPCRDDRACVAGPASHRDTAASFEFSSEQIALRVAAAFRYATSLCQA